VLKSLAGDQEIRRPGAFVFKKKDLLISLTPDPL
jgi:hypothetical protein